MLPSFLLISKWMVVVVRRSQLHNNVLVRFILKAVVLQYWAGVFMGPLPNATFTAVRLCLALGKQKEITVSHLSTPEMASWMGGFVSVLFSAQSSLSALFPPGQTMATSSHPPLSTDTKWHGWLKTQAQAQGQCHLRDPTRNFCLLTSAISVWDHFLFLRTENKHTHD